MKVKTVCSIILLACLHSALAIAQITSVAERDFITITGQVTDYDNQPIAGCAVRLVYSDFGVGYEVYTDENGYYKMNNVKKGVYLGLFALRLNDYPVMKAVPEDDMRLEFWAWNVIASQDMVINPKYHKLELYGTTVFETASSYIIYTRPMSLGSFLKVGELKQFDLLSPSLRDIEFYVYADNIPLKIHSVNQVEEYAGEESKSLRAFVLNVEKNINTTDLPYIVFRVKAYNKEYNELGENYYFYKKHTYMSK